MYAMTSLQSSEQKMQVKSPFEQQQCQVGQIYILCYIYLNILQIRVK